MDRRPGAVFAPGGAVFHRGLCPFPLARASGAGEACWSGGAPVRSRMVKQNTRKLRELIENYEEIRAFLNDPLPRQEYSLEKMPAAERLIYAA